MSSVEAMKKNMKILIPETDVHINFDRTGIQKSESPCDWEWRIIEQLVSCQIHEFFQETYQDQPTISTLHNNYINNVAEKDAPSPSLPSKEDIALNSILDKLKGVESRRNRRRKLIQECRKLREEISRFEIEFSNTNKRPPKTADRRGMQQTYTNYKNLKRLVRDEAAMDIQRIFRGMHCRKQVSLYAGSQIKKWFKFSLHLKPHAYHKTKVSNKLESSSHTHVTTNDRMMMTSSSNHLYLDSQPSSVSTSPLSSPRKPYVINVPTNTQHEDSGTLISPTHSSYSINSTTTTTTTTTPDTSLIRKRKGNEIRNSSQISAFITWLHQDYSHSTLRNQYRETFTMKQQLKTQLKRFDEEFKHVHGRLPTRREKEAMRSTYEQYHELKSTLTRIKSDIELKFGASITDEILMNNDDIPRERVKRGYTGDSPSGGSNAVHDSSAYTATRLRSDSNDTAFTGMSSSSPNHNNPITTVDTLCTTVTDLNPEEVQVDEVENDELNNYTLSSSPSELHVEKKRLLTRLKEYEREFVRIHNRPVTKYEDILPVATEYKRYKELKTILNESS